MRTPYRRRLGDSPDNANRDHQRQREQTLRELDRQLAAGEITQEIYDASVSVQS